jgi:outer membrane protein OmpA-like peptidoglycan-associated protein
MRSLLALSLLASLASIAPLASTAARAHADGGHTRHFPGERLEPGIDTEAIGNTEWAGVPDHFGWDVALWLDYENDPLFTYTIDDSTVSPPGGRVDPLERDSILVANRVHSELALAFAVFDWVQIGLQLPVLLYQSRDDTQAPEDDRGTALGSAGIGDIQLRPKIRVLRQLDGAPLDIALLAPISFPTGQFADYFGEQSGSIAPGVAMSREFGNVRVAANLLHRFRDPSRVFTLAVGNELLWRAAASYRFDLLVDRPTEVGLSVVGAAATDEVGRGDNLSVRNPIEALVDVQHKVWGPLDVFFGAGAGLIAGNGVPDFRLFGGLRWADRPPSDYDQDGLSGTADKCPRVPENKNGFEDDDGCPDSGDSDKDGIGDSVDDCKDVPEDMDGFEDKDGCPDDDDKDGIADASDGVNGACKKQAEDKDGFEDGDGCPDDDNDKDGVKDADDKCKDVAEDRDEFEDDDGCPDFDNDKDGFADEADGPGGSCKNEAGPKANKGCPDKDRDGDTVVDRLDNCPDEPGTPENGGCKAKQLVVITDAKLEIKERVYFKTARDVIESKSFALLDNVAAVLKAHPEITKIRVEGHTDDVGDDATNKDLSNRRAASVKRYLIEKGGVDAARLDAQGFGEEKPVAKNDTEEGKQENRRVEFVIVNEDAPPAETKAP